MVCCLTAPSHYLKQCWLIISKVHWHSSEGNFTRDASTINYWNCLKITCLKISFKSPRGQWVNLKIEQQTSSLPNGYHGAIPFGCVASGDAFCASDSLGTLVVGGKTWRPHDIEALSIALFFNSSPPVPHICDNKLGHLCSRSWLVACSTPGHHLDQY